MLQSWQENMKATRKLDATDDEEQDPTVYLWLLYYRAMHCMFTRDFPTAMLFVEEGIEHTPTVVELYVLKAKIFKFAGDLAMAAKTYDEGRTLDTADRYLSCHTARYQMRVDDIEKGNETMLPFSRDGPGGKLNVHEMQTMWYEIEAGNCYLR